MIASPSTCNL